MPQLTGISHLDLTVSDVERSAQWYSDVFGLKKRGGATLDNRSTIVLVHPDTGLVVGLVQHHEPVGTAFDERHAGLDHVGFSVADRAELDAWEARFAELGVEHSPVTDSPSGSGTALVFRDPDNIQLEMWWTQPR
jgi:catechol 2,3-dioxygenase-like lactoylglutathione lyase family enzyme